MTRQKLEKAKIREEWEALTKEEKIRNRQREIQEYCKDSFSIEQLENLKEYQKFSLITKRKMNKEAWMRKFKNEEKKLINR